MILYAILLIYWVICEVSNGQEANTKGNKKKVEGSMDVGKGPYAG